jgi:hypothetical protein
MGEMILGTEVDAGREGEKTWAVCKDGFIA